MNKPLLIGVSPYKNINSWELILNKALTVDVKVVVLDDVNNFPILDYIIFDGGADVCPYFYGENKAHRFTSVNVDRDDCEYFLYQHYLACH